MWKHWLEALSSAHTLIRYDRRGCGLSDWDARDFSLQALVSDLGAVVDAAGLDRFPMLGIAGGGPVALKYATLHPQKVSHLILYGSYGRGRFERGSDSYDRQKTELLLKAIKIGWGQDNPAFRQLYTVLFILKARVKRSNGLTNFSAFLLSGDGCS